MTAKAFRLFHKIIRLSLSLELKASFHRKSAHQKTVFEFCFSPVLSYKLSLFIYLVLI